MTDAAPPPIERALVAGVSGVVGRAVAHELLAAGVEVLGLSRRDPGIPGLDHHAIDLSSPAAVAALSQLPPIDTLVFCALHEEPGLLAGWRAPRQMETNRRLLTHCLDGLATHPLAHVTLLQGTKAYGAHVQRMRVPGREREPRVVHENFYWLQEDLLRERAAAAGFAFTIWRPPVIIGHAVGAPMNVLAVIGVYAALCRELGEPCPFPGGPVGPIDVVDTGLLAEAIVWGRQQAAAQGATFNVSNGDVIQWPDLWPALVTALGAEPGPPVPRALAEWLPQHAALWDRIRDRDGLRAPALADFLGDSPIYADMLFGFGRTQAAPATLLSTIALRQAGFAGCRDSEDALCAVLRDLCADRWLPTPPANHA